MRNVRRCPSCVGNTCNYNAFAGCAILPRDRPTDRRDCRGPGRAGDAPEMPVRLRQIEAAEPLAIDYRPVASLIPYARNARTHSESAGGADRRLDPRVRLHQPGAGRRRERHHRRPRPGARGAEARPRLGAGDRARPPQREPEAGLRPRRQPPRRAGRLGPGAAGARGGRPLGARRRPRARSASRRPRSMRCCAPPRPTRARRRPRSRPRSLFLSTATSGSSGRIGCSAAAPPSRPTWRACSAVCGRTSWSRDPPFGVNYDPSWRNTAGLSATKRTGKVLNDDRADWREAWALFPGEVAYVWHGALHATTVAESLVACGFAIRSQIIWAKERLVLSRGDYHWQHEPCWYAVARRARATGTATASRPRSGRSRAATRTPRPSTARRSRSSACAGRCSTTAPPASRSTSRSRDRGPRSSPPRPAAGSASRWSSTRPTSMWRSRRWQSFTGETATLDGDGRSFAEVAAERVPA